MNRRWLLARAFAGLGVWFAGSPVRSGVTDRAAWPNLPAPPGSRLYWVAESLVQNGLSMQIKGFESAWPLSEVLNFFERWLAGKPSVTKQARGTGWLMGARLGDFQVAINVQLVATDGTSVQVGAPGVVGTLTATRLGDLLARTSAWRSQASAALPLPPGTTILSDTRSNDPGRRSRVLMATNGVAVEANTLYLREHLIARGWSVIEDRTLEPGRSSLLTLRRGQGRETTEALITVVRQHRGMMIVASLTTGGEAE